MSCFDDFNECSGLSDNSPNMSISSEVFLGNWKIVECINISKCKNSPPARIEGAVFTLQDNGEIRWDMTGGPGTANQQTGTTPAASADDPPEIDGSFPLFQCDCYEIVHSFVGISIQMGQISGHMFEFWIDRPIPRDTLLLTFEGWIMLQCQQVKKSIYAPNDSPFSLLPAFTEGFFSDLALSTKSNGASILTKEFKIHSIIMSLADGKMEELSSLPADVLETALYYLYSLSLPPALSKETVARCVQLAPASMTEFMADCKKYLHRILLKRKILKLVNEVHSCAETMSTSFHEDTVTNPNRFCAVIKTILRHGAVAFIKLVELCVLYGEEANQLERAERLEILRYAKTRLPIFLTQFVALLRNIKNDFATVRTSERNDIATCITPEIENLLDLLSNLMKETKDACNDIWVRWSKECSALGVGVGLGGAGGGSGLGLGGSEYGGGCGGLGGGMGYNYNPNSYGYMCWQDCQPLLDTFPYATGGGTSTANSSTAGTGSSSSPNASTDSGPPDTLVDSLYNIFRKREIMKLHSVQGQVAAIYLYLSQKRENFEEMTQAVKVRCVARNLEQLLEELPIFLLRLEEIMIAFDDRFQWKDFKFCLQLAISQVYQTVQHLVKERDRLQKFFLCLVDLVQRDEFYQSLVNLKLLINTATATSSQSEGGDGVGVGVGTTDTGTDTNPPEEEEGNRLQAASTTADVDPGDLNALSFQDQSIEREEFALLNSSIPESMPAAAVAAGASATPNREAKDKFSHGDYAFSSKFDGHGHFDGRYQCMNNFCNEDEYCVDELKLLEDLCTPRRAKDSALAENCAKLCSSVEYSDMVFEIPGDDEKESLEIPAHRVIMAARCDWFRRALLSGMRESIQKRIVIHDCSPQIFQLFLNYVYSGKLEDWGSGVTGPAISGTSSDASGGRPVTLDTLSDLIALADRYEMDSLKITCEQELVHKHLDENSVIFLLSLADQYNARTLRGSCMEYIATNPDIMAKDLFEQLSPELQMEVYDITMWSKPKICLI